MPDVYTIREHEKFSIGSGLTKQDLMDLKRFATTAQVSTDDGYKPVLDFDRGGSLKAGNHVGVITTSRGKVVEILPKIDLGGATDPGHEQTREVFLTMLRDYRGLKGAASLPPSAIQSLRRFPMLEVFIRLFLQNVGRLVLGGLSRRYVLTRENLPFLRGRIVFRQHLRENLIDRSRFFVEHDELSPNRPANRLIRTALDRLRPIVRNHRNKRLLADLEPAFSAVPPARDPRSDWLRHTVDRSMPHYNPVMPWVELFLFNRGLATWSGKHVSQSLLFPMEKVFEDFVTQSFRRHQRDFQVVAQGPSQENGQARRQGRFRHEAPTLRCRMRQTRCTSFSTPSGSESAGEIPIRSAISRVPTFISSTPMASGTPATSRPKVAPSPSSTPTTPPSPSR